MLTPPFGASTEEAQCNIGIEVAQKLALYSDNGSTLTAVNFPEVSLPEKRANVSRLLHIHTNVPGIMRQINDVFASQDINVAAQYLQTTGDVGYVVMDIHSDKPEAIVPLLKEIPGTLGVPYSLLIKRPALRGFFSNILAISHIVLFGTHSLSLYFYIKLALL